MKRKALSVAILAFICIIVFPLILLFLRGGEHTAPVKLLLSTDIISGERKLSEFYLQDNSSKILCNNSFTWGAQYSTDGSYAIGISDVGGEDWISEVNIKNGICRDIIQKEVVGWSVKYLPNTLDFSYIDRNGNLVIFNRSSNSEKVIMNLGRDTRNYSYVWFGKNKLSVLTSTGIAEFNIKNSTLTPILNADIYRPKYSDAFDVSLDGTTIAFLNSKQELYLYSIASKTLELISQEGHGGDTRFALSHDGKYLAYSLVFQKSTLFNPSYYKLFLATNEDTICIFTSNDGQTPPRMDIKVDKGRQRDG